MATNTTNYNLVKPAYADTADIADINGNMDIIDGQMKTNADGVSANATSLAKSQGGLAYIVGNTNTTGGTLSAGTYMYVKGHSSIAEGLRIATASISNNGSITTSNTSAVSGGGLNSLNSKVLQYEKVNNANDATDYNKLYYTDDTAINVPKTGTYWSIRVLYSETNSCCYQIAVLTNSKSGWMFVRQKNVNNEWSSWNCITEDYTAYVENVSTKAGLDSILTSNLNDLIGGQTYRFRFNASASFAPFVSGETYYVELMRNISTTYARANIYLNGGRDTIVAYKGSSGWTYEKIY